jgi:hypothetical protein
MCRAVATVERAVFIDTHLCMIASTSTAGAFDFTLAANSTLRDASASELDCTFCASAFILRMSGTVTFRPSTKRDSTWSWISCGMILRDSL